MSYIFSPADVQAIQRFNEMLAQAQLTGLEPACCFDHHMEQLTQAVVDFHAEVLDADSALIEHPRSYIAGAVNANMANQKIGDALAEWSENATRAGACCISVRPFPAEKYGAGSFEVTNVL